MVLNKLLGHGLTELMNIFINLALLKVQVRQHYM